MKIKSGANFDEMTQELKQACAVVTSVYQDFDYLCVLTSGKDGKHGEGSLHYEGLAADFRTRQVKPDTIPLIADECRKRLGKDFEVFVEKDHIHIEYDPNHDRRIKS